MNQKDLSKFMSLILRHEPTKFGLVLDAEGYTPMNELLEAIQSSHPEVTLDDIVEVVEHNEPLKKRFTIVENDIRANYGHSIEGKIAHEEVMPPDVLYHGTYEEAVAPILASGLKPMSRQYVHLTTNRDLAKRVGGRRGKPVVLKVDANVAWKQFVKFYRANDTFWLVDNLPAVYLTRE
jgi:putative RNA 2'-phosphotransferase